MAIGSTAIWRVRIGGSNTNGGGYDASIAGAGTDYSQQDAAQLTHVDGVGNGTTTFTSALGNFTSAMVGNGLYISGGTLTAGWYFIITFNSATSVVLDRSPGTGTGGTYAVGGAWADPWANVTSTGPLVPGNIIYVRGAGSDNPGSNDYTKSGGSYVTPTSGNTTVGLIKFIGENGRPRLSSDGLMYYNYIAVSFENFYFTASGTSNGQLGILNQQGGAQSGTIINCVFDQNGKDITCATINGLMMGCECFSSTTNSGAAGTNAAIKTTNYGAIVDGCNIHDVWGDGVTFANDMETLTNSIIAKCTGNGVTLPASTSYFRGHVSRNTIDGNKGHAVTVAATSGLIAYDFYGNLITNHTGAGKYGINVAAGTTAVNDATKMFWDFNWFYNNTANYNAISGGPHDTTGTDPKYKSQSTEDYTLTGASTALNNGFPTGANPTLPIGASPASMSTLQQYFLRRSTTPNVEDYVAPGAVQPQQVIGTPFRGRQDSTHLRR